MVLIDIDYDPNRGRENLQRLVEAKQQGEDAVIAVLNGFSDVEAAEVAVVMGFPFKGPEDRLVAVGSHFSFISGPHLVIGV